MAETRGRWISVIFGIIASLSGFAEGLSIWREKHSGFGKWLMALGCVVLLLCLAEVVVVHYRNKQVA
jgi:hypothetical protein